MAGESGLRHARAKNKYSQFVRRAGGKGMGFSSVFNKFINCVLCLPEEEAPGVSLVENTDACEEGERVYEMTPVVEQYELQEPILEPDSLSPPGVARLEENRFF